MDGAPSDTDSFNDSAAPEISVPVRQRNPLDMVVEYRLKHGMCHRCGTSIYDTTHERGAGRLVPRNEPGVVAMGRCLFCYPGEPNVRPLPHNDASVTEDDVSSMSNAASNREVTAAVGEIKLEMFDVGTGDHHARRAGSGGAAAAAQLECDELSMNAAARFNEKEGDAHHVEGRVSSMRPSRKKTRLTSDSSQARKPSRPSASVTIQDADGVQFSGSLLEGTDQQGRGKFIHVHKGREHRGKVSVYEGECKAGFFHGIGTYRDVHGCVYSGSFVRGEAHGYGECEWPQGWHYKGEWAHDKRQGYGIGRQLKHGGEVYTGQWLDDKWDGEGKLEFAGGGQYDGGFQKGKLHGSGRYEFADGSLYQGSFKKDLREGHGEMTYVGGDSYIGDWHRNWRHGRGSLLHAGGTVWKGRFRSDEKHGVGYLHLPDGILRKEKWTDGVLQEEDS